MISLVCRIHSITGKLTAFLAGSQAEIRIVTRLTAVAPATAGSDTFVVSGTPVYKTAPNRPDTTEITPRMHPSPARMPMGIPAIPMHSPSKRTELRSCFSVAPTEASTPISRIRSLSEMLKEL